MKDTSMDETLVVEPTTAVESVAEDTASQGADPIAQATDQSQSPVQPEVDQAAQPNPSQDSGRVLPSDFYQTRKLQRQLQQKIQEADQFLAKLKTVPQTQTPAQAPVSVQPSKDDLTREFIKDPSGFLENKLSELKKSIRQELLETEFPALIQKTQAEQAYDRGRQEGLELLFPPDSTNPKSSIQERAAKNPARLEAINRVFQEYSLDGIQDPVKAAKTALKILQAEKVASQNKSVVPQKGQMGSTATGTMPGGGRKNMTLQEIQAKQAQMTQALDLKPELRNDENFNKQWSALNLELSQAWAKMGQ